METLKNIQNTANGTITQSGVENFIPSYLDEEVEDTPKVGYKIFKLVNSNRKGGVYIPNIDDVVNPKTGKTERIRLLNGIDTIWMKEQKDLTPEYIRQNGVSLIFPRGQKILIIHEWETTKMEFALACRHNIGNPYRKTGSKFEFYEYNPQRQAEEAYKKEMLEMEMVVKASQLSDDKVRKMASFLGIPFNDELGQAKPGAWLKKDLMVSAKRDPKRFEDCLDSKEVDIQFMIRKAIIDAKIDLGGADGKARWATGGNISPIPQTRKPLEYLTELAMTNSKEGKEFLKQLQQISK